MNKYTVVIKRPDYIESDSPDGTDPYVAHVAANDAKHAAKMAQLEVFEGDTKAGLDPNDADDYLPLVVFDGWAPVALFYFNSEGKAVKVYDTKNLAQAALDAACKHIQDELGVTTGDLAGLFFSGPNGANVLRIFKEYAETEIREKTFDDTEDLFHRLNKTYPDKVFDRNERGVIYLIDDDMAIFDPTLSSCGRFESEDFYGLSRGDAEDLRDHNMRINPNLPDES